MQSIVICIENYLHLIVADIEMFYKKYQGNTKIMILCGIKMRDQSQLPCYLKRYCFQVCLKISFSSIQYNINNDDLITEYVFYISG